MVDRDIQEPMEKKEYLENQVTKDLKETWEKPDRKEKMDHQESQE